MNEFLKKRMPAGEKSWLSIIQGGTFLIIALVVAFGDAMFVKLMWGHFPDGLLRYFTVGGAFTTALSILLLVLGKERWFRPGPQLNTAYIFTSAEVLVSVFNVLCASGVDMMAWWLTFSPATPFLSLIGWIVIRMLDPTTKQRHEEMEMEDDITKSNLAFRRAQHDAEMQIRYKALEYNTQYMIEALESPNHQQTIATGADKLTTKTIQQLLGITVAPAKTIEATTNQLAPVSLGQTEPAVTLTPTQFKQLLEATAGANPTAAPSDEATQAEPKKKVKELPTKNKNN